jgi:cyanophycin synthetase
MFDEVIIRQDRNLRGKTEEELIAMVLAGVKSVDPDKKVTIIPSEAEAITYAITNAVPGSLIVVSSDVVPDALNLVMKFKEEESNRLYEITKEDIPNL